VLVERKDEFTKCRNFYSIRYHNHHDLHVLVHVQTYACFLNQKITNVKITFFRKMQKITFSRKNAG